MRDLLSLRYESDG